jgi:branched-chain amino acid transport system permease protein
MLTASAIVLDGLVYASWLFVVAVGLTLIFGVMKILNVAHGSLYAFGAYATATFVGVYFRQGLPPMGSFAMPVLAALAAGIVLGIVLERGLLRFMYQRDEVLIVLVTYAAFLILEDAIKLIWGVDPLYAAEPYSLLGVSEVSDLILSNYDLSLIGLALFIGAALWVLVNRTRWGKLLLAVIHDREMSEAFGINVTRVFTVTFVLGAVLGAAGGAFTAPMISVTPGIGVEVIVLAFAVVVIGGLGSVPGATIGALIVGVSRAAAVHLLPEVELFVIYGVMSLVLVFRPQGLFGRVVARRI